MKFANKLYKNITSVLESMVSLYTSDVDITSVYPSVSCFCNISRVTMKYALTHITGFVNKEDFNNISTDVKENSVVICNRYCNLPDYKGMEKEIQKLINQENLEDPLG